MELVSNVKPLNIGITKIKHAKDVLILSYMINKSNNVSVLLINLIFLKEDVFLVIYHIIGTQILVNAFHVLLHLSTITKLVDVFVLQIDPI